MNFNNFSLQKRLKEDIQRRLKLIPRQKFDRVFDAGCGDGFLSQIIQDITKAKVYGIDISSLNCKLAREKGVIAKRADLNKKIPFKDSFFDLVFAGEIIEHLHNPDNFLKEIKRTLKSDGIFVLTTPNLASWYNRIILILGIQPYGLEASIEDARIGFKFLKRIKNSKAAGHLRLFTLAAIEDLLEFHGFKIEKVEGFPITFFPPPIYTFEKFMSFFPSLSSHITIKARKKLN